MFMIVGSGSWWRGSEKFCLHAVHPEGKTYVFQYEGEDLNWSSVVVEIYDENHQLLHETVKLGGSPRIPRTSVFDAEGNLIVAGEYLIGLPNNAVFVAKHDPAGEQSWSHWMGQTNLGQTSIGLAANPVGDVLFTYKETNYQANGGVQIIVYDQDGTGKGWGYYRRHFYTEPVPQPVQVLPNGDFLFAMLKTDNNDVTSHLIQRDSLGNDWKNLSRPYDKPFDLKALVEDENGDFIYTHHHFLTRLDNQGNELWSLPTGMLTKRMIAAPGGGFLLMGIPATGPFRFLVKRFAANGTEVWQYQFPHTTGEGEVAMDGFVDAQGVFNLVGMHAEGQVFSFSEPWSHAMIMKLDLATGDSLFSASIASEGEGFLNLRIQEDTAGYFYLSGFDDVLENSSLAGIRFGRHFTRQYSFRDCELPTRQLQVYPNPATTEVNLNADMEYGEAWEITVMDALGKKVHTETGTYECLPVPLSLAGYPEGIYYLRMEGRQQIWQGKLWLRVE